MNPCNGPRSKTVFGVRRALWYREWRSHRGQYGAAALLIAVPWLLEVLGAVNPWSRYSAMELRGMLHGMAVRSGASAWDVAVAGLLGASLLWSDRIRGPLAYVLEGPVSRRAVLQVKVGLSVLAIGAGAVMEWGILGWAAAMIGDGALGHVWIHALYQGLIQVAVALTALGLGTAMGSLVFVVMASASLCLGPRILGGMAAFLADRTPGPSVSWLMRVDQVIRGLPPFARSVPHGWGLLLGALGLVLWVVCWVRLAHRWWGWVAWEHLGDPLYFPFLWNVFYAGLAFLSGFMGVLIIESGRATPPTWLVFSLWGALGFIAWFVWRWVVVRIGQTALAWGPGVVRGGPRGSG